jgi:hypothetical protein
VTILIAINGDEHRIKIILILTDKSCHICTTNEICGEINQQYVATFSDILQIKSIDNGYHNDGMMQSLPILLHAAIGMVMRISVNILIHQLVFLINKRER